MTLIRKTEDFAGQILHVMPRPLLAELAQQFLLQHLIVTDIGWYPEARYHYRERYTGAPEHILILCVAGSGWLEVGGSRHLVNAREAVLIPRNLPHVYGASEEDPWSIQWVHLHGPIADYFFALLPENVYRVPVTAELSAVLQHHFRECFDSIMGTFVEQRMIFITQTIQHLLGHLFFNNRLFSPALRSSQFHNLDSTLDYLRKNISQPLTLQQMADHAQLSKSHFARLFKEQTNYSPVEYFIRLKLQRACMQLALTRKTIREISYNLGYTDPYYFSRIFKKIIGKSPSQFRADPQYSYNTLPDPALGKP
ncbi:MAG: AraC family transcriptional regulator [Anaerolineales bacterium]|nr:AraC family transcriptional regulator [Anaerolineales bacterium]